AIGAVRGVDAVLLARPRGLVVLDHEIVAERRKDAPLAVLVDPVAAQRNVIAVERADARARRVGDREALDPHPRRALDVDRVAVGGRGAIDRDRAVGDDGDRPGLGAPDIYGEA